LPRDFRLAFAINADQRNRLSVSKAIQRRCSYSWVDRRNADQVRDRLDRRSAIASDMYGDVRRPYL